MENISSQPQAHEFQPTRWTLVAEAGDPAHPSHEQALEQLLHSYRPVLVLHLTRRHRMQPALAEDLLQEFIVKKILQYNLPARANRERGRFRTLLLTSLDNFTRNQWTGRRQIVSLAEDHEICNNDPAPGDSFDVPWARQVLQESLRRMQAECRQNGRLDMWDIFEARIVAPALEGAPPIEYEQLIIRHKLQSPMQASNLLVSAKRGFERTLRVVISEYADEDEIETEIADLRHILACASA
jgi:DNA-directed RNA polymerase specialized sigma24 family protein